MNEFRREDEAYAAEMEAFPCEFLFTIADTEYRLSMKRYEARVRRQFPLHESTLPLYVDAYRRLATGGRGRGGRGQFWRVARSGPLLMRSEEQFEGRRITGHGYREVSAPGMAQLTR